MATSKPRLDRRIVRSRNAILSAFERLLMEKPLADITVSAIAREANVDRKTFYVHFGTVDGLLDAIAVDVVGDDCRLGRENPCFNGRRHQRARSWRGGDLL
ncbi:MAG: TetR/AcrR family transcriptional regulator [Collinsella aerofaciens]